MSKQAKRYWLEAFIDDFYKARQFVLASDHDAVVAQRKELLGALEKIAAIEDGYYCGDWDEIEEAREIARAAIAKAKSE